MPYQNQVSSSPLRTPNFSHARQSAADGFDNVGVGNGSMPPTPGAARSPQSHGEAAGFQLRYAPSLDSLNSLHELGQMHDASGFDGDLGMGDSDGGDGLHRADYAKQMERSHPLDLGQQSPRYQGQHGQDIARELSPLIQQWDQRAGAIDGLRTPQGATPPDALFSRAQIDESSMSREHCARTVLAGLGVTPPEVETLLRNHARSEGGTAILDACRLLTMPELIGDPKAHATLQKQLKGYLKAARGDYSGVYRAFAHHSSREIKKLKDGIETTVAAIGYSVVKDRLLADLAPALVHALERKNPGMSSEALRARLPELINAQGFSALTHRMNNANASGLLQDAPLLPQFVESAEEPKPPPAGKPAEPVNDFVKHLVSVLGAIKPPNIHIENNAKQTVHQDGWNFQGNKDPRPEKTADAVPLTIKALPEVDDLEEQALDEGIDMIEVDSETEEMQVEDLEVEKQVEEDETAREDPPRNERSSGTGRFGAPVHPLLGSLLSDLRQNARYQHVANGGAHPIPDNLVSARSVEQDEDEEETVASSARGFNMDKSDRASAFGRLATAFEPGKQPSASHFVDAHERVR
ncbi:hypothetical protein ABE522_09110 [Stenotrophomonas pennii]|uniref:hypothetical protein n=1 Tax=Stenotrophomonas lacuserhaii TaxID=2760084 RepID=UPI003209DC74